MLSWNPFFRSAILARPKNLKSSLQYFQSPLRPSVSSCQISSLFLSNSSSILLNFKRFKTTNRAGQAKSEIQILNKYPELDAYSSPALPQSNRTSLRNQSTPIPKEIRGLQIAKKRLVQVGHSQDGFPIFIPPTSTPGTKLTFQKSTIRVSRKGNSSKRFVVGLIGKKRVFIPENEVIKPVPVQLDFSSMFSKANDTKGFVELMKNLGYTFKRNSNQFLYSLQSELAGAEIVGSSKALQSLGHELVELTVMQTLAVKYPHMPHDVMGYLVQKVAGPPNTALSCIKLGITPYIKHNSSIKSISEFPNPEAACSRMAHLTYICIAGAIHNEHGFEIAQQFIFDTLHFEEFTIDMMKHIPKISVPQGSKIALHSTLRDLLLPIPTYHTLGYDHFKDDQGHDHFIYESEVKSGNVVLAKGRGTTKLESEQMAAQAAIFSYWIRSAK